jgi:hypothetical protein
VRVIYWSLFEALSATADAAFADMGSLYNCNVVGKLSGASGLL